MLLLTFDPKKIKNKKRIEKKIQNTRGGYTGKKPRRLSKLVVYDQNNE
jgi:hypothetical protein